MKRRNIKRVIRTKLNLYLKSITDPILVQKMKSDILVTGGSIASMLLDEEVKDFDVYFRTRETTLAVAEYYCKIARDEKIADMWVLHKGLPFVQDCLQINIDWVSDMVKSAIKEQDEKKAQLDELDTSSDEIENEEELTIDTPLEAFPSFLALNKVHKFEGHEVSLRILHNIYNTFKNDENRIKSYSFGSFGVNGETLTVDPNKIDSQEVDGEDNEKYEIKFISANAITLSDKIQLVTRFYGTPEEIHKNFDFVHAMGVYDYRENELHTTTEQLEALLSKTLIYKGSLYPLASIFRARKFINRGWGIDAGQYLKMAFQLNDLDLLDPYTLEEQLTGVDLLYFYQIISDLKYKQLTNDDFKPSTEYFIKIIERVFE